MATLDFSTVQDDTISKTEEERISLALVESGQEGQVLVAKGIDGRGIVGGPRYGD